ncbi:MAG TPA: hypothetical protein PLK99_06740 [Burkholderiales bacterium]|nr:hypothetical protein [Burkholderiales bacterium]
MTDEFHWWGQDIQFSASGDDLPVSGVDEINQRILRGLLTNPGEYIWHPTYGAGLGKKVGIALSAEVSAEIKAAILAIMRTEPDVQMLPQPTIELQSDSSGFLGAQIIWVYTPTGQQQSLSFKPSK